jgi:hypothetical protein
VKAFIWFVLIAVFSFTATGLALAAGAAVSSTTGDGSAFDLLRPVYDAFAGGHYAYAGMLALVLVVALLKRYAPAKYGISAFVHGDAGGSLLTLLASFGGAMATSLAGGAGISFAMAKTATLIAVGAAGGYAMIKKLIVEPLRNSAWYQTKAPAWLKAGLQIAFWIFDKPDPVASAEDAGQKAVDAKPGAGNAQIVDKPTEIK